MWLIAMKGPPGSGKSTIARALSKRLACPLIDKDDIRDLLPGRELVASGQSYDITFHIARRQLLQGLSVICDSPLTSKRGYQRAQAIASETRAALAILECTCSDDAQWSHRINGRKTLPLPPITRPIGIPFRSISTIIALRQTIRSRIHILWLIRSDRWRNALMKFAYG